MFGRSMLRGGDVREESTSSVPPPPTLGSVISRLPLASLPGVKFEVT
jgi:hypothetical protein